MPPTGASCCLEMMRFGTIIGDGARFLAPSRLTACRLAESGTRPYLTVAFRWRSNPSPKSTSTVPRQFEFDLADDVAQMQQTISNLRYLR